MIVIGGGLAGACAAIAARQEGAPVELYEQSTFPRHKVCGEFLSPEAALLFRRLGVWNEFQELKPWAVREAHVRIGRRTKSWRLEEPAFGVSRYALDDFLFQQARKAGATIVHARGEIRSDPAVLACGRQVKSQSGNRIFGFKTHFSGPVTDRIVLLFASDMYVGVNCVEDGKTNVCGLASEALLKRFGFHPGELVETNPWLAERLNPLRRSMEWMITGPLAYGAYPDLRSESSVYRAGDALGFVDPFTGSGMLAAISTGMLAGRHCALGSPIRAHHRECGRILANQYLAARLFRILIDAGVAQNLAWLLPGSALFRLTRPAVNKVI